MMYRFPGRVSRLITIGLVFVVLGLVAAAGFWAGRVALAPPDDPLAATAKRAVYEVVEQTIGQSLQFAATAEWKTTPLVRAAAPGMVTSIGFAPGDAVDGGDVLFTVNLRPTVVAAGDVPAFRDLHVGDRGADVRQWKALLVAEGLLDAELDDEFDEATAAATREWQESLGLELDGIVRHGDVLFTPELPVRVVATEALSVGATLTGGEVVVSGLAPVPTMVVPLTSEQRNLVPLSGTVRVHYAEGTWEAVIARAAEATEEGVDQLNLVLEAPDGGVVCGDACAEWIPFTGRTSFEADIVLVPETTGPVVPVAAIVTDPGGDHSVQLLDGTQVSIDVLVSTGGLAVVDGVEPGDVVVLPFAEPPDA
jgi:peptidoglycan hydrolase-like protein with peptidoglycan-binding domain